MTGINDKNFAYKTAYLPRLSQRKNLWRMKKLSHMEALLILLRIIYTLLKFFTLVLEAIMVATVGAVFRALRPLAVGALLTSSTVLS